MRVIPSALVAELRGSTAELTAASWKGINYVRRKVIPANPNSAAQQAVRNSMTRCVTLWRSLSATVKAWLDVYGTNYAMSGFNVFTSKNRALEQVPSPLLPVPDHPNVAQIADFAENGSGATNLIVTWTDPVTTGFTNMFLILRNQATNVFSAEILTVLASAATYTFAGLTTTHVYDVYGALYNPTTGVIGTTNTDEHTIT